MEEKEAVRTRYCELGVLDGWVGGWVGGWVDEPYLEERHFHAGANELDFG